LWLSILIEWEFYVMKLHELLNYEKRKGEKVCNLRAELSIRPRSLAKMRRSLRVTLFD